MFDKNGIICVNKPTGMSSSLAVSVIKRVLKPQKIGHMGTLDPLGTGILLVGVNKATKLFDEYLTKQKTYRTIFKFGIETDTLDSEGKITRTNDCDITKDCIDSILNEFIGEFMQMPPLYSAKKINGKKAYELARQGQTVELKPRKIQIFEIKCLSQVEKNTFCFDITCSAGTYIRSVVRDIAKRLNTCGTMVAIIRTKCGSFDLENSYTLEQIKSGEFKIQEI